LLIAKIIISGFYLQSEPSRFSVTNLALAENNKAQTDPPPNPPPKETEESSVEASERLLEKKEQGLKEKEMLLKKREERLLPLKKEIDDKLEELNELQTRLTAFARQLADREKALTDSKIGHLVNLYTAMEPAKAAAIMDKLNVDTVVRILRHMKGKSAGKILSMMNPELGATISEKLSQMD